MINNQKGHRPKVCGMQNYLKLNKKIRKYLLLKDLNDHKKTMILTFQNPRNEPEETLFIICFTERMIKFSFEPKPQYILKKNCD